MVEWWAYDDYLWPADEDTLNPDYDEEETDDE